MGNACALAQAVDRAPFRQGSAKAPLSCPTTHYCCPNIKFHYGLRFEASVARAVLRASNIKSTPHTLAEGLVLETLSKNYKFWIEPRYCMVLRLKPMGKPTT